jgi:hypothetical protein
MEALEIYSDKGKCVEPRGLEPLTPCLQSGGVDFAKRRSGALGVAERRCTAQSSGDTAVLCCCTGSLRSADLVRLAATGWRRPKCGVEYELPKLKPAVFDHKFARPFSLGITSI